jgi:probable F420-dependent oxidoreductase
MAPGAHPFRFGMGAGLLDDPVKLIRLAQRSEELGFSTFSMADHFMLPFAPLVALQAVADATTTIRLSQTVLDQDFRLPTVLAKELATLDVLSGGRVQVGIGAGWMREEYEQAGIHFAKASLRIERLEEVVIVLKGLFAGDPFSFSGTHFTITELSGTPQPVQLPRPPIMIGGGGRKLLGAAARQADIIQMMPSIPRGMVTTSAYEFTAQAYEEKVGWIRDAAGGRFDEIELGAQFLHVAVTPDRDRAYDEFMERFGPMQRSVGSELSVSKETFLSSPVVAVGTLDEVCEQLEETRARLGISYWSSGLGMRPAQLAPVIERLSGR